MSRTYNVIDADGHVLEPPSLCTEYLDPAFRDRAPELFLDEDGHTRLRIEGKVLEGNTKWGFEAMGGLGMREGMPAPKLYTDGKAGGFDPKARIADLDVDGIDVAFLYPSLGPPVPLATNWTISAPLGTLAVDGVKMQRALEYS